jgi:hypothetical protein
MPTFQPIYYEPGNKLPLISLGGVVSIPGQGRIIKSINATTGTGADGNLVQILDSNPKRISCIIQNIDDPVAVGSNVSVYLGSVNTIPITLGTLGVLQIDKDFPCIGAIIISAAAGAPVVTVQEIGLQ